MQAVVSGVAAAIGYGIGAAVGSVLDRLGVRAGNGDAWRWTAVGIMLASALVTRGPDMPQPRGHDVSEQATWFPIISGVAAVADLFDQLSTPPGFGHVYDHDYLDGWARVVPPDGWTDADTRSLEDFLLARSGG